MAKDEKLCKALLCILMVVAVAMTLALVAGHKRTYAKPPSNKPKDVPMFNDAAVFTKPQDLVPTVWESVDFCNHTSYKNGIGTWLKQLLMLPGVVYPYDQGCQWNLCASYSCRTGPEYVHLFCVSLEGVIILTLWKYVSSVTLMRCLVVLTCYVRL